MNKQPKPIKTPKPPLTELELLTIEQMWQNCRWIEIRLLRPQGVQKPISFKPNKKDRGV